jgi:hypothetical protein
MAPQGRAFEFDTESDGTLTLDSAVFQAIGAASMSWIGGTGNAEFDSAWAEEVGRALIRFILDRENSAAQK